MYTKFFKKEKLKKCVFYQQFLYFCSPKNQVSLAQLVEQLTLNQWVQGSSP